MLPDKPLPIDPSWSSADEYVQSLLTLVSSSDLLRNLCGGAHILDFLTRQPDLYTRVLPQDWREWFDTVEIDDFLDFLLHEDLVQFQGDSSSQSAPKEWRGAHIPPTSLVSYVDSIRRHCLDRTFVPRSGKVEKLPRRVEVGMKTKKNHEVVNFAAYVNKLSTHVSDQIGERLSIIDFGSGQNYLGRTLALPPYNKHVIAIERHHHNIEGAKGMDISAKLAKKNLIMRNKKLYKQAKEFAAANGLPKPVTGPSPTYKTASQSLKEMQEVPEVVVATHQEDDLPLGSSKGSMTYIEHELSNGVLEHVLYPSTNGTNIPSEHDSHDSPSPSENSTRPKTIAVSIHSCGNLTHHGLRSIVLNPSITAVAMIGCCYNLLTERLGPATYKLPQLRPNHPRLEATSNSFDPHGFPMSKTLETFEFDINTSTNPTIDPTYPPSSISSSCQPTPTQREKGVRLNITARMMAVQAPQNWTKAESRLFFTRHFYRALLQRVLLDKGVVKQAASPEQVTIAGNALSGRDTEGTPLIIGSLRKRAFTSFTAYVHAAMEKIWADPVDGEKFKRLTEDLVTCPEIVRGYEERFGYAKKNLSVIWSLMAFSAGVVESTIVVDRWLWLKEQEEVADAWVETVFDYALSPRNLVVVGVKRNDKQEETSRD